MRINLGAFVAAPIQDVFAFFDDPANTLEFNTHARRFEVVAVQPDGRRTIDFEMNSGAKTWMQTVEQEVREPPTKLVTRGGTWTSDRRTFLMTVTTDRSFSVEGDGTRLDVTVEFRLDQPWRRPFWTVLSWIQRGATQLELEHQLYYMTDLIAARHKRNASIE